MVSAHFAWAKSGWKMSSIYWPPMAQAMVAIAVRATGKSVARRKVVPAW